MKEYPYWWDTVPSPEDEPHAKAQTHESELPDDTQHDVVVVGAGYTGLAAARHLARVGASTLVLDRDRLASGASSRNGGQVLTGLKLSPETLVARYGEKRARALFDASTESIARLEALTAEESIDCDYERVGHIQAAWKPAHFEAFRREQALLARVFQHRVELVSKREQGSEIGSDRYHGLLVDERSGALNPARYAFGLGAAAMRAGACVLTGVAVRRIEKDAGGWRISTSSPGAGAVRARDVLVATNGYTDAAAPALRRRFVPIGSFIIATTPLSADVADRLLPRRRMAFDSKNFLFYFRLTRDRRLLFGGRAEFREPGPDSTRRAAAILRDGLRTIFPELANQSIEYAWGGNVAFTRDQLPHAGKLEGTYFAGGYCGHGIAMATVLGETIARRIAGEPIDHPFVDDRFAPIPFYSGRPWFLPLVGAYYRFRDLIQ